MKLTQFEWIKLELQCQSYGLNKFYELIDVNFISGIASRGFSANARGLYAIPTNVGMAGSIVEKGRG